MSSKLERMSSELSPLLHRSSHRVGSALMRLFPINALSSSTDPIHENEILVILRTMSGEDHIVAIANTQFSSTLFLWAATVFNVYHKQIALFGDTEILTGNEIMTQLVPLLKKTDHVLHVIVKNDPSIIPGWISHSVYSSEINRLAVNE